MALPPGAPVCVGFSGGLDSVVLLELLARHRAGHALGAVHVHHGLSPNADEWARTCARFCDALGVALAVERVHVDRDSPHGLEAAARAARYAVYAARPEPYVALAHHLDDQAETALLQLLRGTGLKGAAAMPEVRVLPGARVRLFRPLLGVPREVLREHAQREGLRWVDDESNASLAHDRNFLRHEIAVRLDARFDGWREALARFSRHAAHAGELLDELARLDGVPARPGAGLPIDRVPAAIARRANALRAFLAVNDVAMPGEARLLEMARQLFDARGDARVRIDHEGVSLVRHRGVVRLEHGLEAQDPWRVPWRGERELDLGAGRGRVCFEETSGAGLAAAAAGGAAWHFAARSGGERIRLAARRPTRTLKNLLQESALPAWERQRLPLLFDGVRLVWVPGVGIAADYACPGGAPGLRPSWTVAGKAPLC